MVASIRRFVRGQKGMEALQAVIILGAAFVITYGLIQIWSEIQPSVKQSIEDLVKF